MFSRDRHCRRLSKDLTDIPWAFSKSNCTHFSFLRPDSDPALEPMEKSEFPDFCETVVTVLSTEFRRGSRLNPSRCAHSKGSLTPHFSSTLGAAKSATVSKYEMDVMQVACLTYLGGQQNVGGHAASLSETRSRGWK
jgi:hypothetical protein